MVLTEAIRLLRSRLGESQESMARRLGCSTSGYVKWERGVAVPGGEAILTMMRLCPDPESRAAFEIGPQNHAQIVDTVPLSLGGKIGSVSLQYSNGIRLAIEDLLKAAQAGDNDASEILRDTFERLLARRRVKVLPGQQTAPQPNDKQTHASKLHPRMDLRQEPHYGPGTFSPAETRRKKKPQAPHRKKVKDHAC